jgi:hypothetical protein
MKIAFAGASATGKTTLTKYLAEQFNLLINPHGSRSMAKEMGFVNEKGDGDPYAVDRAFLSSYENGLRNGDAEYAAGISRVHFDDPYILRNIRESGGDPHNVPTVRSLFQKKLQAKKIEWERHPVNVESQAPAGATGFVTDRTTLDDLAYTLMHAPDVVDAEFKERAYAHLDLYDVIFYTPLAAGQWLGDDPARVPDPMYHWRYDVLLRGLLVDSGAQIVRPLWSPDLESRKQHVLQVAKAYFLGETR